MNDKKQMRVSQENSLFTKNLKVSLDGDEIKASSFYLLVDTVNNIFECQITDVDGASWDLGKRDGMFFLRAEVGPFLIKGKTNDATEYSLMFRTSQDNPEASMVSVFTTRVEFKVNKNTDSVCVENLFISK